MVASRRNEVCGNVSYPLRTVLSMVLPTLAVGWRASALRGKEAGPFREVAGVSIVQVIVAAGGPRSR